MPELIDLQVMAENISNGVKDQKLKAIAVPVEKTLRNATLLDLKDSIEGKNLTSVERFSKFLVFNFDNGVKLLVHLMLHGNLCWKEPGIKQQNVVCQLDFESKSILMKDWSRWMVIELEDENKGIRSEMLHEEYGIDPFSGKFTEDYLLAVLSKKPRSKIKAVLMDQHLIGGIGNAYADEILFDAKINPKSTCKGIVIAGKIADLWNSIKNVLNKDLEIVRNLSGGTDLAEQNRDFMKVYRKMGQTCPECHGDKIIETRVASRDTFICPSCQKEYL